MWYSALKFVNKYSSCNVVFHSISCHELHCLQWDIDVMEWQSVIGKIQISRQGRSHHELYIIRSDDLALQTGVIYAFKHLKCNEILTFQPSINCSHTRSSFRMRNNWPRDFCEYFIYFIAKSSYNLICVESNSYAHIWINIIIIIIQNHQMKARNKLSKTAMQQNSMSVVFIAIQLY